MGALHELWERYRDRVEFLVVYVREAHPEDGWVLESNREQQIAFHDPVSLEQRAQVAETCATRLEIDMPVVLDALDNQVAQQYGGWPDRLYLIGRDGRIAYQGDEGPSGFKPELLAAAIEKELKRGRRG